MVFSQRRVTILLSLLLVSTMVIMVSDTAFAQRRPPTFREFLAQYKGKEILIMDRTTGAEQFAGGDANKAYHVVLTDVLNDYMVVSRATDTDKRTFAYPLSVIRRIIYLFDGRPYQKIVVEMY